MAISLIRLRAAGLVSSRGLGCGWGERPGLGTILTDLKHAGLITSHRGAEGGYLLARPARTITVAATTAGTAYAQQNFLDTGNAPAV